MTTQRLKDALAVIWAIVYRAPEMRYLTHEQTAKLKDALKVISAGKVGDDYFNRLASHITDGVLTSGILSTPSRNPEGTEQILNDCERLQQHLAAEKPSDSSA